MLAERPGHVLKDQPVAIRGQVGRRHPDRVRPVAVEVELGEARASIEAGRVEGSAELQVEFAFPTQTIHVATPEDLEHTDRPGGDPEGASWGRRVAHELVERSLEPVGGIGARPAPVRIVTRPAYGDDGADGGGGDGGGGDGGGDG